MALIRCPECGKEISDSAGKCIHCGFPLNNRKKESNAKKAIIPGGIALIVVASVIVLIVFLTIMVIGSIFLGVYIKNKPKRERINACLELINEETDGKGTITKIYYYEEGNYCYVFLADGDEATVDLENKTCGLKSDYEALSEAYELAKIYGMDNFAKTYAGELLSHEYNVFAALNYSSKPNQFELIYEK